MRAGWGIYLWVLLDIAEFPIAATLPLYFFGVWLTEQVELPALGLTPPSWKWGARKC